MRGEGAAGGDIVGISGVKNVPGQDGTECLSCAFGALTQGVAGRR